MSDEKLETKYEVGTKLKARLGTVSEPSDVTITGVIKKTFDPKLLEDEYGKDLRYYLVEWEDGTQETRHEVDIDRFVV
jgi:hypothetical protein